MDWKMQLGISIIVPLVSSTLTYLAAIRKSKSEIETVKISADTEIKKIKEESEKELKRIQKETDEQIRLKMAESDLNSKLKEDELKNQAASKFMEEFMKNPKQGTEIFNALKDFSKIVNK
ncbi:MAG: hypothetical protein HFE81_07750 [Bacilli bacterium]|nr:hypothetical protein [Bacilli bacterium]